MGPAILARALGDDVPYAVKIHGSALEYVVKRDPARFVPYAREGLAGARAILVGSLHTGAVALGALEDVDLRPRTRLGPPGVEVEQFVPRERGEASARVAALARRLQASPRSSGEGCFARDDAAAGRALAALDPGSDRLVAFVGKLILSKGVDLLAAAWPLVLARVPDARLVIVGFGAFRDRLRGAAGGARPRRPRRRARARRRGPRGRGRARGPAGDARGVPGLAGARAGRLSRSRAALARAASRSCGRLDHDELAELLPAVRGAGGAEHVPGGFRHGRRRGRRVRGPAGQRGPLRAGRGGPDARGGCSAAGRAAALVPARPERGRRPGRSGGRMARGARKRFARRPATRL